MVVTEQQYIAHCLNLIELGLNWGPSKNWVQRDYDNLSHLVFDKTQVLLSVSTLKRLWNNTYKGSPHPGTLNALVMFLDFDSWVAFKKDQCLVIHESLSTEKVNPPENKWPFAKSLPWRHIKLGLLGVVVIASLVWAVLSMHPFRRAEVPQRQYENVFFNARKVVENGVPNSVIFDYDISRIASDSVFVSSGMPMAKRSPLEKDFHNRTCVFYYPGYFKIRLWVDTTVIREQPVHITTNGWQALVHYDYDGKPPIYIPNSEYPVGGHLYLSPQVLSQYKVDTEKFHYFVSFYQVWDFGPVNGDHFTIEARLKNDWREGGLLGQHADIVVLCENGNMYVPMVQSGMVGNMFFGFIDVQIDPESYDLSPFGCDVAEWHDLKCVVHNRRVQIFRDAQLIYTLTYHQSAGEIKGIRFLFHGCGAVDWVRLFDQAGTLVYDDSFGSDGLEHAISLSK